MSRLSRKPLDKDLYDAVVAEAKSRFDVWPSAYASGWVVKTYKARGGRYAGGDKKTRSGLTKWFGESWVDLSRPIHDEDGELTGYEPCGRKKSGDPADYPKCRPAREAMRMSPAEVKDAIKRKRAAEAKAGGRGGRGARAPVRVATYRANPGVVLYHRTTPANAAKIVRERRWMSREQPPYVFFSTDPYGHTSYGEALLEVVVPEDVARLDDEFPSGEQHYAVLTRDLAGLPVRLVEGRKNPRAQWFHGGSVEDVRQVKALGHFPAEYAPRLGNYGAGVYLTSDKEEAQGFGEVVIGVSVDPSVRFLDMRDSTYRIMPSSVFDRLTSPEAKAAFEERWYASDLPGAVAAGVTADGYDGILWKGDDWNDWAVVFDPTKVLHATRRKNPYDPEDDPLSDVHVIATDELEDGTVVKYVASPFPYERKPLGHRDDPKVQGLVNLAHLIGTQRRVSVAGVEKYLAGADEKPPRPGSLRMPAILVYETSDGRQYIADGHHRAFAALLRDMETFPAIIQLVRE